MPYESIMEAVAELEEDLARVEIVGAAEGEAVVEEHAAVGDVDGLEIDGEALTEVFSEREIKRGMRLEMAGEAATKSPLWMG